VPPIITGIQRLRLRVALAVVHAAAHVGVQAQEVVAHQHLAVGSAGTGVSTRRKLSTVGSPLGREASTICLVRGHVGVLGCRSVGGTEFLDAPAAGAHRQAAHVLEGAGGVTGDLAVSE
jgi:hypothetical protein